MNNQKYIEYMVLCDKIIGFNRSNKDLTRIYSSDVNIRILMDFVLLNNFRIIPFDIWAGILDNVIKRIKDKECCEEVLKDIEEHIEIWNKYLELNSIEIRIYRLEQELGSKRFLDKRIVHKILQKLSIIDMMSDECITIHGNKYGVARTVNTGEHQELFSLNSNSDLGNLIGVLSIKNNKRKIYGADKIKTLADKLKIVEQEILEDNFDVLCMLHIRKDKTEIEKLIDIL